MVIQNLTIMSRFNQVRDLIHSKFAPLRYASFTYALLHATVVKCLSHRSLVVDAILCTVIKQHDSILNLTTTSEMSAPKGKQKAIGDADDLNESDLEPFPQSYLEELLEKAKAAYEKPAERGEQEEDILTLEKDSSEYDSHPLNEKLNPYHSCFAGNLSLCSRHGNYYQRHTWQM